MSEIHEKYKNNVWCITQKSDFCYSSIAQRRNKTFTDARARARSHYVININDSHSHDPSTRIIRIDLLAGALLFYHTYKSDHRRMRSRERAERPRENREIPTKTCKISPVDPDLITVTVLPQRRRAGSSKSDGYQVIVEKHPGFPIPRGIFISINLPLKNSIFTSDEKKIMRRKLLDSFFYGL